MGEAEIQTHATGHTVVFTLHCNSDIQSIEPICAYVKGKSAREYITTKTALERLQTRLQRQLYSVIIEPIENCRKLEMQKNYANV